MTTMEIRDAYRIVFNDLMNMNCDLLVGKYDAKHGSEQFVNGIGAVMRLLAYGMSVPEGQAFEELFSKNMIESEKD